MGPFGGQRLFIIITSFQVTKFSLHNVPNPHTNQVLYEAEIWIKDSRSRRKLDLMVKYPAPAAAAAASGRKASGASLVEALFGPPETACFSTSCFMSQGHIEGQYITTYGGRYWVS